MKFNKKDKGWILEELEKKNECLDADSFGGENPEDVEKEREEKEKEINKRFTEVEKTLKKVKGEDHEEKGKPMKEYLENKKDLSTFVTKLKEQNIHYTISRSDKEDYRYVVEYYEDKNISTYRGVRVQFNEGKYLVHFDNGELVEANSRREAKETINKKLDEKLVEDDMELLELPEEEPLPDAVPDEPIVVSTEVPEGVEENAVYMALSSELRDTLLDIENLKSLVVTIAGDGNDEVVNELNSIIDDRTIHSGVLQSLMAKYDTKVEAEETTAEDEVVADEEEIKEESLKEEADVKLCAVYSDKDDGPTMEEINKALEEIGSKIENVKEQGEGNYSVYFKASKDNLRKVIDRLGMPHDDDISDWIVSESLKEDLDLHDKVFNIFGGEMKDADVDSYIDNIRKTHNFKSDDELLKYIEDNKED